ncbi:MAG: FRG domain-containing protein [Chloroflexota bacterium]
MTDIIVESWLDLHDKLFQGAWHPEINRFRAQLAFRGLSDANYELTTSLMRQGPGYEHMEKHMLRNFRKYAHRDAVPSDSSWNWLTLAQHHGLPTRLMDWTFSPYVAMHFATANLDQFKEDGVIWAVDYTKVHQTLPLILRQELTAERADLFTVEMLDRVVPTTDTLETVCEDPFLLFLEPPSVDDRVVNQYALLSVTSCATERVDDWLADHPDMHARYVIPAALKWEIRDKLDQANVTERVLFPGLDGLSTWLKRNYKPRRPAQGRG